MKLSRVAFIVVLLGSTTVLSGQVVSTIKYSAADLGPRVTNTAGINDSGQIAGSYDAGAFRTAPNAPFNPATDGITPVATGQIWAVGKAINNSGEIAGEIGGFSHYYLSGTAFRSTPTNGAPTSISFLGVLAGAQISYGNGINNSGQVVGSSSSAITDSMGVQHIGITHAFRTAPETAINPATDDLGTLGGSFSSAAAINSSGQVAGTSDTAAGVQHAFRTGRNLPINVATDDLGTLGGAQSDARAMNDAGQVVGAAETTSGVFHAYRTAANSAINSVADDLGTLGGPSSASLAINAPGKVVGTADTATSGPRAFLYAEGKMFDLNDLIINSIPSALTEAKGINASGQIIANSGAGPDFHAYRLDPALIEIEIAIKPGSAEPVINSRSAGKIPVAILSTSDFNAPLDVNQTTLTFGTTGEERSRAFCSGPEDVNGDGLTDLVCLFDTRLAGFEPASRYAVLKGQTLDGIPIQAREAVRVIR